MPGGYHLPEDRPGDWETPLTRGMIVATRRVGSPRPSPDSVWVAYTVSYDGRTDLYLVPASGGVPRQLTTDQPISGGNYCWTPDSSAIIYTSKGKLWRIPAAGGVARQLTEGEGAHLSPAIAPDGHLLALVADRDEEIDIGVAPLLNSHRRVAGSGGSAMAASSEGGVRRPDGGGQEKTWPLRVSSGSDFTFDPQWAPDSSFLVWMAYDNRKMPWDESRIVISYRTTTPLGEARVVAGRPGFAHVQPRVSPDGRRIAFLCDATGWLNVWLVEVESGGAIGEARPVAPEQVEHGGPFWPFDIRDLAWSPDGTRLAHLRNVAGRVGIALLDPDTGERTLLTDLPGTHEQIAWCGDDALVCAFNAPNTPLQIVRIAVPSGQRTVLANGAPLGAGTASVLPQHISYQTGDGRTAYGFLYTPKRPASGDGYPLLVHFHGGPTAQVTEEWNGAVQYFVGRGWAVIQVNYRGSSGYGKAYKDALNGLWGEGELRDALGAIDHLAASGLIDRTRVVAWGGSNGGFDTLYCLSKAPDQFAAGVCLYGFGDLPLLSEETHRFERYYADTLVGPLPRTWQRQRELSPLHDAARVQAPLLILHGGKDTSVPINQSESFVEALKRAGKEYEYQVYPEEGHGWQRGATVLDYLERMDRFLLRYVLLRGR